MNSDRNTKQIFDEKLAKADAELENLAQSSQKLSSFRLVAFIAIIILASLSSFGGYMSFWWTALPLGLFVFAILRHDKILRKEEQQKWIKEFYEDGIKRLTNQWQGNGIHEADFSDENHLYSRDLDIFGKGSLFELICTAQTASGERQLARWLMAPSKRNEIDARQKAVQELTEELQLREDIAVAARRMRSLLNPARLNEWALCAPQISERRFFWFRILFFLLGAAAIAAIVSCFFTDFGLAILAGVGIVEWIIGRILKPQLSPVLLGVEGPRRQLKVMSDILARYEKQSVESPLLKELKAGLFVHEVPASKATSHLGHLVDWLDQSRNQVFAPVAFLLMWSGHFALSIEKWRLEFGRHIPEWLEASGNLEALCSLAGFAFEHPHYAWPNIVDGSPRFEGTALGHPLLSEEECVCNSISLSEAPQLWLVSGSNMSGKSTFLRIVGINAVLAMAGGPVFGTSLTLTPFAIGSTIRVLDSLQKGRSKFYAEISTLKQIVELTQGEYPLLFLLDEIFHGTNSHDRTIGARAVISELVARGALGLVTTHDLALTKMADELGDNARNVHFDDMVKDGLLSFDYTLKEGPVTRSNALELMRSVGLNV
ncbi:MAG: DNA mismatch repair protein MutS [Deltaproteobacteria bacterium]|nr:DNA mismatch repair protein MutS [Deltaproteobacteria bacterium]